LQWEGLETSANCQLLIPHLSAGSTGRGHRRCSDRVIVMTAGPGRIESDNPIDLARPHDVSAPDFNDYRRRLTQKLTSHVARREIRAAV